MALLASFLIGIVAGLRAFTAPAVVSWAAWAGWVNVGQTWASWFSHPITVGLLTVAAALELIGDKLPRTPSRRTPMSFGARILTGGVSGAAIGGACGLWLWAVWGAIAGVVGAIVGTLGGYQARKRLVAATGGRDLPIALAEDAVAVFGALAIVGAL